MVFQIERASLVLEYSNSLCNLKKQIQTQMLGFKTKYLVITSDEYHLH